MRTTLPELTEAEWKVMKIVWRLKACAARDVYTRLSKNPGWAPTTVKTLLARLVDKGYLKTQPVGNTFLYRPAVSQGQARFRALDTLVDRVMDGAVGPMVAYLVQRKKLSRDDLDALRKLLDEHQERGRSKTE